MIIVIFSLFVIVSLVGKVQHIHSGLKNRKNKLLTWVSNFSLLQNYVFLVSLLLKVSQKKNEKKLLTLPSDEDTFDHKDGKIDHTEAIEMVVTNEVQSCLKHLR